MTPEKEGRQTETSRETDRARTQREETFVKPVTTTQRQEKTETPLHHAYSTETSTDDLKDSDENIPVCQRRLNPGRGRDNYVT